MAFCLLVLAGDDLLRIYTFGKTDNNLFSFKNVQPLLRVDRCQKSTVNINSVNIHPSIIFSLSPGNSSPDTPLSSHAFQLLLRRPKTFPGQTGYIIPPGAVALLRAPPGCSSSLHYAQPPSAGSNCHHHKIMTISKTETGDQEFCRPPQPDTMATFHQTIWPCHTPSPLPKTHKLLSFAAETRP